MKKIYFLIYDPCIVHGGFFDNFEYYYLIKKNFPECEVKYRLITKHPKSDVIAMLDDKYENVSDTYGDIEVLPFRYTKFYRKPITMDIIFCATNSAMYWFMKNKNIQAAKTYIGLADYWDVHPSQYKMYKNNIMLGDERIFNYVEPYRKKILFDKFKKKKFGKKYDYMMNLSLAERRFSKKYLTEIFDFYNGSFVIYTGRKNKDYYNWLNYIDNVKVIYPPVENFMDLFHTFVYVPYTNGKDSTPRLIPECKFYGKEVELLTDIKSGGYHRYYDTINDFDGLRLKDDDEILDIVGNCL